MELDQKFGIVSIEFKQAVLYKRYNKEWIPKEVFNNSKMRLEIIQNNSIYLDKSKKEEENEKFLITVNEQ